MFAFTKEQRQAKLARTNVDNYNKLELSLSRVTDSLQREAILNAMADIVDIFTMLRSTYELYKPVRTTEDYRLLRVPGMPGIVLDYRWIANDLKNELYSYYASKLAIEKAGEFQQYLVNALLETKLQKMKDNHISRAVVHGVSTEFSENTYDTLINLVKLLHTSRSINVVANRYNREICQQFAHHNNIDILISI